MVSVHTLENAKQRKRGAEFRDAKYGTTTGVSAEDRAKTILNLASKSSRPEDFNRPGHIFPLRYRERGGLKRAGHTKASVHFAVLAELEPAAVLDNLLRNMI